MKDFNELTLADVALNEKGSIISGPFGSNISSKFFVKQGVPVIRGNNLTINNKSKFIDSDFVYVSKEKAKELNCFAICEDIIFTAAGTIGQVGIIEKNSKYQSYVISNKQMRVRLDKRKVNPYYVYYWLSSSWVTKGLIKKNTGSTVPLINLGIIKSIKINLPKERYLQDNIANLLNNLDKKIELNNRINAELEAMAKTLYDYWFVQFDFPNEEGKPYKSSGGKMVYNTTLKQEIPDGWIDKQLNSVVERIGTGLNPRDNFKLGEGNNYYITIKDIEQGRIIFSDKTDRVSDVTLDIINKRSDIKVGDILFTSIQPVGLTYLIHEKPVNWNINESVFTIRANESLVTSEYLFKLLSSEQMKVFSKNSSSGSIHKGIRHGVLKNFVFAYANLSVIKKFTEMITPLLQKQYKLEIENNNLQSLRDFLLPMLMNGQVTVK